MTFMQYPSYFLKSVLAVGYILLCARHTNAQIIPSNNLVSQ